MSKSEGGLISRLGGSKLAGLIFETEDGAPNQTPKKGSGSKSAPTQLSEIQKRLAQKDVTSQPSQSDEPDEEILGVIYEDVVSSQSTPFTKFLARVEQMKDVVSGEDTLFAVAAKADQSSQTVLIDSIDRHQNLLRQEREEFDQEAKRLFSQVVGDLEARKVEIEAKIKTIEAEIQQLQDDLAALRSNSSQLGGSIETEQSKIETGKQKWHSAANSLSASLDEYRKKILTYLKEK